MTNPAVMTSLQRGIPTTVQGPAEVSPFVVEFFMVQNRDSRCMAYCDEYGLWRNAFNNEELVGEIHLLE
jgi:hypothetical protein